MMTKEEVPVVTGPGFLVKRVCVVEGERVEPGDVLFEADLTDLDELLKQTESQIRAEEAKLAELNNAGSSAVNRANQDLKDASESSAGDVGRANEAYQAAVALRDNAPSEDTYKKKAYEQDAEYQRLSKAAEKKNATKKEKEEFRAYKKSLDARLSESYAQEKQALNDAVSEKEQALSDANKSRMDSVKQA
ncbi:MAG: biotin/lipoyl-binding protein, partial [Lachnospiraceae bacterium]|nr:biotin/lipoyl-binding protein [Lachnospiraceae bacterium]